MSEREPITAELRAALDVDREFMRADGTVVAQTFCVDRGDFERLCEAIDAVHASLERENAELRQRVSELDKRGESMHDGGRITDELRAWWVRKFPVIDQELHKDFTAIADRIDAEHESACAEAYGNGVMSVPIALDESQWVKLPVDADGEVIHIGDEMEYGRAHGRVIALMLSNYPKKWGGGLHWGIQLEGEQAPTALDLMFHHYHAPTVEDVLRKFADEMNQNLGMYTGEAIDADEWRDADNKTIAEFAAKLRLAEEVDG